MKGFLVRVGIDSATGGWNSPVDPITGKFAYVPIPEDTEELKRTVIPAYGTDYSQFRIPCQNLGKKLPAALSLRHSHIDPDFEYLSYGDADSRGKPLFGLERGDFIAFYAGLRPTLPYKHRTLYALIGFYEVDRRVSAIDIPEHLRSTNAHTRRVCDKNEVIVFGKPGRSGRLDRCIPIGEFRDKAYRVTPSLLDAWGGITVHNGWLQRSAVLPRFEDAERFYSWFRNQNPSLVSSNNL